jgi:Zn-dependent protease
MFSFRISTDVVVVLLIIFELVKQLSYLLASILIHELGHLLWAWKNNIPILGVQIFNRGSYKVKRFMNVPIVFHCIPGTCSVYCGDVDKEPPVEHNISKAIALAGPCINIVVGSIFLMIAHLSVNLFSLRNLTDFYVNGWCMFGSINLLFGILNLIILKKGTDGWYVFRSTKEESDKMVLDGYEHFMAKL